MSTFDGKPRQALDQHKFVKITTAVISLLLISACAKTEPASNSVNGATKPVTTTATNTVQSADDTTGPSGTLEQLASGTWKLIDHDKSRKPLSLTFHSYTPDGDSSTSGDVDGVFGAPGTKHSVTKMGWQYLGTGMISITNIQGHVHRCNMQISGNAMNLYCDNWGDTTKMRYVRV